LTLTLTLQLSNLLFELLVAVLQLLHRAGELSDGGLEAINASQKVGIRGLRAGGSGPKRTRQRDNERRDGTHHPRRVR
jgi:hypothetical protein